MEIKAEKKKLEDEKIQLEKEKTDIRQAKRSVVAKRAALLAARKRYSKKLDEFSSLQTRVGRIMRRKQNVIIEQSHEMCQLEEDNKNIEHRLSEMQKYIMNVLNE